ncbi:hypothetical protein NDU88_008273 [Pleurodeles waltl]|uniref:Uncharacterized protein n=1 Tax=Pleurodeles waltl TaxID=8319 RepID=A0AAV7VWQ1_PLEWA|nr:hypothetical protein NDU88_008272 [Pleurodeles waltl]KAJ1204496.1 hypothetical protein NDU88_008273 [Pleurodeles waltl]
MEGKNEDHEPLASKTFGTQEILDVDESNKGDLDNLVAAIEEHYEPAQSLQDVANVESGTSQDPQASSMEQLLKSLAKEVRIDFSISQANQ